MVVAERAEVNYRTFRRGLFVILPGKGVNSGDTVRQVR